MTKVPHLEEYYRVIKGTDTKDEIKKGDYVKLKNQPFLAKEYVGCIQHTETGLINKFYGYVLEVLDVCHVEEEEYVSLGQGKDVRISRNSAKHERINMLSIFIA